jgi:Protein of unknown function (DUF2950)
MLPLAVMAMAAAAFVAGCSKTQSGTATEETQRTFATAAEAGQALHAAAQSRDGKALAQVLSPEGEKLISSGDAAVDRSATDAFAKKYDQMNRLVAMTDGSEVLYVGADNYPFPVPLAQDRSSRWYFDTAKGEEELRARKIGRDELDAMDFAQMLADAEQLYQKKAHQFTDTIVSTPGKRDGLYWEASSGQPDSPLGFLRQFSRSVFGSSAPSKTIESHGYSYRIVTNSGGFTVFATPLEYQHSGIMTFSVGKDGVLYEKDLEPENVTTAMSEYNPSYGWRQAE